MRTAEVLAGVVLAGALPMASPAHRQPWLQDEDGVVDPAGPLTAAGRGIARPLPSAIRRGAAVPGGA